VKVLNSDPLHDDKVRHLIRSAMHHAEIHDLDLGIGVIDFKDCTVVALSDRIPFGEVFEMTRHSEDSFLHGGFGDKVF